MGSNPDFRDLFCELNAADARYLIYQVGIEPNRIDILMADDLITAKRAAGRLQDQLDLQRLEEKKSG